MYVDFVFLLISLLNIASYKNFCLYLLIMLMLISFSYTIYTDSVLTIEH